MADDGPFWERKTLTEMTRVEWESLCDGCGRCCLVTLEDEDNLGVFEETSMHCRLFDKETRRCGCYARRSELVPECVPLRPDNIKALDFMPKTCAYRLLAEDPWYGCLSAVSSANDVMTAMEEGISIDEGGPQDEAILAAAHMLRGLSWGYLGLIFDQGLIVEEGMPLDDKMPFSDYKQMIEAAVEELEEAISVAESLGEEFIHASFNGLVLNQEQFVQLAHSYAARFLAQWPRTAEESVQVDWPAVERHAAAGLQYDFAPYADGKLWQSYQHYAFAETGAGPFWARADQRLVAALDPAQPTRYPEVETQGEAPLQPTQAQSNDKRLETDFTYFPFNAFSPENGEWHFSHYQHSRNVSDPGFAGNGQTDGPMPVFLAADNGLLQAEALFRQGRKGEAVSIINSSSRVNRGELPALSNIILDEKLDEAIRYERAIELLGTAPMGLWFDRRRWAPREEHTSVTALGGLQYGTPAQLPVPARELQVHGMEPYNFGGPKDPEGIIPVY